MTAADAHAAQQGRCYLCTDLIPDPAAAVLDYHPDCPHGPCGICLLGLACPRCAELVNLAGHDPDLLRRWAEAAERRRR